MRHMMLVGVTLLSAAVAGHAAAFAKPPAERGAPAPVEAVHAVPGSGWKGAQFLQADKKGRLFLLRAETLEVFPLASDGKLGDPVPLSKDALAMPAGGSMVITAAMSPHGDWLIQDGFQPRVFRGGKEEPIRKPGWIVLGAAFLRDEPVIAGSPTTVDRAMEPGFELPDEIGLVARWNAKEWEPVVLASQGWDRPDPATLGEQRTVRLAGTSAGRLWLAYDFRHRFREYSPSGKLLTEIVVDGGEAKPAADAEARAKKLAAEASGLSSKQARVGIFEVLAQPVTRALAEGRDGRMYFLVRAGGEGESMALERFDPTLGQLQRLLVAIPDPGRATMAAGKDGLSVAAFEAKKGIWQISWERLEEADWTTVEAKVTGGGQESGPRAERPRAKSASDR
jgi:hypothetical protein